MKIILFLLLLPIGLSAQVTRKVDEFTGAVSYVGTRVDTPNNGSHVSMAYAVRVQTSTFIILNVTSDSWVHLSDDTANALSGANKTRVNVTVLKVSQETELEGSRVYTTESIGIKLPTHLISNPFLVRIGGVVYTIPESVVADVREIGRRL